MSSKTRSIVRALAVIMVALGVLMEMEVVILPSIQLYRFWLVVIAFGLVLITSK